jgi:3-phytase
MRNPLIACLAIALLAVGTTPAAAQATTAPSVVARAETPALFDDASGGNANADDPAIWVDDEKPDQSLIIGTAKQGGLYAYGLNGEQVQQLPAPPAPGAAHKPGRFNNVDVLQHVEIGGGERDLAIVSDRGQDHLRIYQIDKEAVRHGRPLADVTAQNVPFVFSGNQNEVDKQRTAYGLTAWYDAAHKAAYVLVSQRETTRIALYQLTADRDKIGYTLVRTLDLPTEFTMPNGAHWQPCDKPGVGPQVEGMAVDVQRGVLYAGQEDVGIWRMSAGLDDKPVRVDRVREFGVPGQFAPESQECVQGLDPGFGGTHVSADVEGLTIYYGRNGSGYLISSSQGDSTFAVYQRDGRNEFVGSFRVGADTSYDGSEHCDGAAVLNVGLGDRFPQGLLVVQDGENTPDEPGVGVKRRVNTNFKLVRWDDVAQSFPTRLIVDPTGYNPHNH